MLDDIFQFSFALLFLVFAYKLVNSVGYNYYSKWSQKIHRVELKRVKNRKGKTRYKLECLSDEGKVIISFFYRNEALAKRKLGKWNYYLKRDTIKEYPGFL